MEKFMSVKKHCLKGSFKTARLCVTRPRQKRSLHQVNEHFVAGASLDFDVFRASLNLKIWKRISIPAVIVVFLCMLLHFYNRESVRVAEESLMARKEAVLRAAQIALEAEAENMEDFKATAYCITGVTKSGMPVAPGHVAADPKVIPLGSVIYVESPLMSGLYRVTDTGRRIKGRTIDIFMHSYTRSVEFGRKNVKIKVLRYGYEGKYPD
jgi:3D (Asp-Asp-Asp) domain-containing protein